MLKQGIRPKIVQERLGHASIQITLDTYSHVAPGLQQAAARRFDDILTGKDKISDMLVSELSQ
jgi:integrase